MRDIEEGAERTRREERVALAPEHTPGPRAAELLDDGGLADAGLPRHEHEPPAAVRRVLERVVERSEDLFPLEQLGVPARRAGSGALPRPP